MTTLRELMDFSSFWTVWFWVTHVIAWSMASHFTLGVPFDAIIQANREKEPGPWSEAVEGMAQAQVYRFSFFYDRYGVALTAISTFLLTLLATLGFWTDVELARALLTILLPLTLIYLLSMRVALRARDAGLTGTELRRAITRQRFWNQLVGVLAVFFAVCLAVWEVARNITPMWQ